MRSVNTPLVYIWVNIYTRGCIKSPEKPKDSCGHLVPPPPHTGLWNIGIWHFDPNRSFWSQMDPKLFNLTLTIITVAPETFQRFMFCIWEIFFEYFQRFSLKWSNFVNFWARKMFFFFKQVRISPEIDWYHYQSANAAPTAIVRHRIKTDPFWRSVTSEPTVPHSLPKTLIWYLNGNFFE